VVTSRKGPGAVLDADQGTQRYRLGKFSFPVFARTDGLDQGIAVILGHRQIRHDHFGLKAIENFDGFFG